MVDKKELRDELGSQADDQELAEARDESIAPVVQLSETQKKLDILRQRYEKNFANGAGTDLKARLNEAEKLVDELGPLEKASNDARAAMEAAGVKNNENGDLEAKKNELEKKIYALSTDRIVIRRESRIEEHQGELLRLNQKLGLLNKFSEKEKKRLVKLGEIDKKAEEVKQEIDRVESVKKASGEEIQHVTRSRNNSLDSLVKEEKEKEENENIAKKQREEVEQKNKKQLAQLEESYQKNLKKYNEIKDAYDHLSNLEEEQIAEKNKLEAWLNEQRKILDELGKNPEKQELVKQFNNINNEFAKAKAYEVSTLYEYEMTSYQSSFGEKYSKLPEFMAKNENFLDDIYGSKKADIDGVAKELNNNARMLLDVKMQALMNNPPANKLAESKHQIADGVNEKAVQEALLEKFDNAVKSMVGDFDNKGSFQKEVSAINEDAKNKINAAQVKRDKVKANGSEEAAKKEYQLELSSIKEEKAKKLVDLEEKYATQLENAKNKIEAEYNKQVFEQPRVNFANAANELVQEQKALVAAVQTEYQEALVFNQEKLGDQMSILANKVPDDKTEDFLISFIVDALKVQVNSRKNVVAMLDGCLARQGVLSKDPQERKAQAESLVNEIDAARNTQNSQERKGIIERVKKKIMALRVKRSEKKLGENSLVKRIKANLVKNAQKVPDTFPPTKQEHLAKVRT